MVSILAQADQTSGGGLSFLLLPVLMLGGLYFLMIRPQKRRAAAQQSLLSSLEVGDEVMTGGGIFGTITEIDEDEDVLTVEIAPGTRVRMVRQGISRKLVEDDEAYEDEDDEEGVDETS